MDWFKEHGGLSRKNGDYFRKMLLSRGGTMDAMEMYRNFPRARRDRRCPA
ncbi:M3 family metallopeptidase [Massilia sp. H-1]|nr:M3 family metallopeptidase [Massilia sp. H-1]